MSSSLLKHVNHYKTKNDKYIVSITSYFLLRYNLAIENLNV